MIPKVVMSFIVATMLFSTAWMEPVAAQEGTNVEIQQVQPAEPRVLQTLLEDMTLVWLQAERQEYAVTACAGNGLNSIQPVASGPIVLIPNAGDLSLAGSNVSIKLSPGGQFTFIPRTQGQLIRVPMNVGDKVTGQEVLSLTFDEM